MASLTCRLRARSASLRVLPSAILDQARAYLCGEQLERAYAQGMALSFEKALDLALRRPGPA